MKKIGTLVTYGVTNYFVNSKNNDTICELSFVVNLNKLNAFSLVTNVDETFNETLNYCKANNIKIEYLSYIGFVCKVNEVAALHDGDVYDKEHGEHIANTKAQRTAFQVANHLVNDLYDFIYINYMQDTSKAINATRRAFYHADNHLDTLIYNK